MWKWGLFVLVALTVFGVKIEREVWAVGLELEQPDDGFVDVGDDEEGPQDPVAIIYGSQCSGNVGNRECPQDNCWTYHNPPPPYPRQNPPETREPTCWVWSCSYNDEGPDDCRGTFSRGKKCQNNIPVPCLGLNPRPTH